MKHTRKMLSGNKYFSFHLKANFTKILRITSLFPSLNLVCILLVVFAFLGCKKFVMVESPNTSLNSLNIYQNDATATSVLTSIYTFLSAASMDSGELPSISLLGSLSSDELTFVYPNSVSEPLHGYFTNNLNAQMSGYEFWNSIYSKLYTINAAIEGLSNSSTLTPTVKQQLLGEAKFMRAFCFFYLVNLYGDVPLVLNTDYKANANIPRAPKSDVWHQIIVDLKEAQSLLSINYLDGSLRNPTAEKVRPTKWVATALLARVYLYTEKWSNAETEASTVIDNSPFTLETLDQVFKKNNKEAIWQLQPVLAGSNTNEANQFILIDVNELSYKPVLSTTLMKSFDRGDQRLTAWVKQITIEGITYPFAYKYKVTTTTDPNPVISEYSTVFRLAEQYLIRAEARIRQNKISIGIDDLNVLRNRASDQSSGAKPLSQLSISLNQNDALKAVIHERQIELFTEWGHRWLDLKRSGDIDEVMSHVLPQKVTGGVWKSSKQLYPLPLYDLQSDSKLIQNIGY